MQSTASRKVIIRKVPEGFPEVNPEGFEFSIIVCSRLAWKGSNSSRVKSGRKLEAVRKLHLPKRAIWEPGSIMFHLVTVDAPSHCLKRFELVPGKIRKETGGIRKLIAKKCNLRARAHLVTVDASWQKRGEKKWMNKQTNTKKNNNPGGYLEGPGWGVQ